MGASSQTLVVCGPGHRLATPRTALVLAAGLCALFAVEIPLAASMHDLAATQGSIDLSLPYALIGMIIARNQPRNPIGWSLLGAGGFLVVSGTASIYARLDYGIHHGRLPLGPVAALMTPTWSPAIVLFALSILLFPDGRLPSKRWRWPVLLLLVTGAVWLAGAFAIAVDTVVRHQIHVEPGGDLTSIDHPTGAFAWWTYAQLAFFVLLGATSITWLSAQIPAYRHASGIRRRQLEWLLAGGGIAVIGGVVELMLAGRSGLLGALGQIGGIGLLGLPISIGISITRYRLYEIDRLISRTLSYTLLTAVLVGVFTGLVLLLTRVLPFSSPVGVAASTLAAAALVNPLRRRLQRLVDRRFNRARYDADALVAAFGQRLRGAVDVETVQDELTAAVTRGLEPSHVSVWIRETAAPRS